MSAEEESKKEVQFLSAFNLDYDSERGSNDSERKLAALCERSFLRLWTYANVFSDEGHRDGKGNGVELCDALLIFENDVVIFSDKQVEFQKEKDIAVAWGRWYRRAVQASVRQLYGAMNWLQRFPARAFLDARCTKKLPVQVPQNTKVQFHLVAVTRGSREAALTFYEGEGRGSLQLNSALSGADHFDHPFVMGIPEPNKKFVHVFDEISIELVLKELDTASDFISFLKKRERLLGRRDTRIFAFGEEDLFATYLTNMSADGKEHVFVAGDESMGLPDELYVEGGIYDSLEKSPAYLRKKDADKASYFWDILISRFLENAAHGVSPDFPSASEEDLERGVRLLAAESRFRRRVLGASLAHMIEKIPPGGGITRLINSGVDGESVYVFSMQPKADHESLEAYRLYRQRKLFAQVKTARLFAPMGKRFIGIALDSPHKNYEGSSEDLFVLEKETWSDEELEELERLRADLDLWAEHRRQTSRFRQDEFPSPDQRHPFSSVENMPKPTTAKRQMPKADFSKIKIKSKDIETNRRKAKKASQRANRRKKK